MAPADSAEKFVAVGVLHALVLVVGFAYAVLVSMRTGMAAVGIAIGAEMALAYVCRPFDFPGSTRLNWKYAAPIASPTMRTMKPIRYVANEDMAWAQH